MVSVVIPAFNMGMYLEDALDSVLNQTYKNLEVIVVDDGSTDNTREVMQRYSNKNVVYHCQVNKGESGARNAGILLARADYIAFLDADDIWLPQKIEMQMHELLANSDIMMVACGYYLVDDFSGSVIGKIVRENPPTRRELEEAISICQVIPGSSSGVVVRKRCFDEVGYFSDELRIGADWEMWMRIVYKHQVRFIEKALVKIRLRNKKPEYRTIANEEKFVKKIIEMHVPKKFRSKAYAALYARLGRNMMACSQKSQARSCLLKSFSYHPFLIFPLDIQNRYNYPKIWRYYLMIKSLIPDAWLQRIRSVCKGME